MVDDDLSTAVEPEEEVDKNISAVVNGELFGELEQYRKERDLTRSKAIRELLREALADDTWGERVREAQRTIESPDTVSFAVAAVGADMNGETKIAVRDGLDEGVMEHMTDGSEALLLSYYHLIDAYTDLTGADFEAVLESLLAYRNKIEEDAETNSVSFDRE